jgi:AmmeMemoRadiSam system protein A/AmmeMemoRadiSam system protein B
MIGSSLVFAGIAPHPPIMVPEVGGSGTEQVRASIDAMREFTNRLIASGAETVVLISPHAPLEAEKFVAYQDETLYGSFANFHAAETTVEAELDRTTLDAITRVAATRGYHVKGIDGYELDHGTAVPLYFLQRNGWRGQVVALGYTFLSNQDHLSFGRCIKEAADEIGRPIAFVASGDLSHRLKQGAPAGYNKDAHLFDEEVVSAIASCEPGRIVEIDPGLRRTAGECGYRSMLVAIGATSDLPLQCDVLSYEAPFGVGYLVAQLAGGAPPSETTDTGASKETIGSSLPALARRAVETFTIEGKQIRPPASDLLSQRAACFVSIKTSDRELRGCIGTIEPVKNSLGEELVINAIHAASRDPRFPPVTKAELPSLRYSVDVLSDIEPTTVEGLDPKIYGIVVEDESGAHRGLLLPDIGGVETVAQQVEIASRKAGILPGTPLKYFRFRVTRYRDDAMAVND